MNQPTLSLHMRPRVGAKVEIRGQRIIGTILRVRTAARQSYWWLDILPETALSEAEAINNVYSGRVDYIDSDGSKRPISEPSDPPLGSAA
ncbi:hypothetical protein [Ferrovibrio sp.]|uniref:hypothetical protein n=1 Tax=Ferrovibrio sp. TaxID=1917215 RepID=UPI0035AF81A3